MNLKTPYEVLLLYHELGTGKTATSISVLNQFLIQKKIFIILPASLERIILKNYYLLVF